MSPEQEAVAAGSGVEVFRILHPSYAHAHELRVMRIDYEWGNSSYYIEVNEPGGCGCRRRVTLGQLTHVLINAAYVDLAALEDRELCPAGHPHHPVQE